MLDIPNWPQIINDYDDMTIIVLGTGWTGDRQPFKQYTTIAQELQRGRIDPV